MDLKSRELVQLAIQPRSPTRQLLLRGSGPDALLGLESTDLPPDGLTFIAPADGRYRLQVGNPGGAPLLLEVPLLARRPAQPEDDTRVAAQEAFREGARWRRQDLSPSQEKAIELFDAASRKYAQLGDAQGQALALSALGACQLRLDQRPSALRTQERALALLARAAQPEPGLESEVRQNLGRAYLANDHAQEALLQLDRALELARHSDDVIQQVGVLTDLGDAYHAVSRFAPSLASFDEALELLRRWTKAHPEEARLRDRAVIVFDIGASRQQQNQVGPAFERFEEALALYRAAGDRHGEAKALNRLGSLHVRGDWARALQYCRRALELNRPHGYDGTEAYIHHNLGHGYLAGREWSKALDHYQAALKIRRRIGNQTGTAASLAQVAWVHIMRGRLETALPILEEARETVEEIRGRLTDVEFRSSYFLAARSLYERYVDLLLQLHARHPAGGYLAQAFEAAERTRARGLLDALGESPGGRVPHGEALRLERTRLQEDLNRLAARYDRIMAMAGAKDPEQIRALDERIDYALSRRQMLEAESGSGGRASPLVGQTLTLARVQNEVLDHDTLLLQYRLSPEQSLLFLVTRERILWFALPPAETIESLGRRVYERLVARQRHERFEPLDEREARIAQADREFAEEAARLSRMILGPAAPYLGHKRLLVAADGMLHSIPFAALPHPGSGRPLLLSHEISYVPSVSILGGIRQELEHRPPAPQTILVMADPVFGADDERVRARVASESGAPGPSPAAPGRLARLRYTGQEAATVATLVPPRFRHIASGFDATRSLARGPEASRCRILHFATHALLNNAHPALSGILLSQVGPDGRAQEGMLRAHEIVDLRLSADMVVLSSCSTGVGQELWGEGLLSLTRAFLRAGAARVVVSLWDVDDAATAELMSRFYENLLGPHSLGPTAALKAAQTAMSRDPRWGAPYYWAAFGVQGEYRPSPEAFQNSHAGAEAAVIKR